MVGRAGLHLRHPSGAKNNEEQKRMKQFLVTYLAPASVKAEWKKTDPAQRREAETKMQAQWKKWMADNAKMFVNVGAGVGKTKLVNTRGTSDTKNDIMLYSVVQRNRMRRRQNHSKGTRIYRSRNPLLKSWKSTHCREWTRTAGLRPAITPRVNKKFVRTKNVLAREPPWNPTDTRPPPACCFQGSTCQ